MASFPFPVPTGPLAAGLELASKVVSTIWPDKSAEEQAQLAAALQLQLGQLEVDKQEAASPSLFTSGWRPFVGWVCASGVAWNWLLLPVARFVCAYLAHPLALQPADLGEMMPLLFGLLGMGGLRSIDKKNGVAS